MWLPRNELRRTDCKRFYGLACCSEHCITAGALICCANCDQFFTCSMRCSFTHDFVSAAPPLPGETLHFVLPGGSTTKKNNPRPAMYHPGGKSFRPIPSKRYKAYEKEKLFIIEGLGLLNINIDWPINVRAIYYRESRRKVDLINLHSALHDMLVTAKVLADDNCSIIISTDGSRVRYDKNDPRTEVWIEPMPLEERPW